jgi:hypothetical protein
MRAKIEKFHQPEKKSIDEFLYYKKVTHTHKIRVDWIGHNKSANKVPK